MLGENLWAKNREMNKITTTYKGPRLVGKGVPETIGVNKKPRQKQMTRLASEVKMVWGVILVLVL